MGVIHVIMPDGIQKTLEAVEGWRVMEIIRDWGLPMKGLCGGACQCGTCHVRISPEWQARLFAPTADEEAQLDALPMVYPDSRLACQILWEPKLDGLTLILAPFEE